MQPSSIHSIYFSPTGTSRKIASAVAGAIACGNTIEDMDLTHDPVREHAFDGNAVAVIAVPVYGGAVAPTAMERLRKVSGQSTPAVIVVLYGNRAFGKAAVQLSRIVSEQGFVPVAAAAFVGEHSYSTPSTPIAAGRPDGADIAEAESFGNQVRRKLLEGTPEPVDAARLKEPHTPLWNLLKFAGFVMSYRRAQKRHPVRLIPETDGSICRHCGRCASLCPVAAIDGDDCLSVDPDLCIRCCACVKGCPAGARTFRTPFAAALSRNFTRRKPPVTLL